MKSMIKLVKKAMKWYFKNYSCLPTGMIPPDFVKR